MAEAKLDGIFRQVGISNMKISNGTDHLCGAWHIQIDTTSFSSVYKSKGKVRPLSIAVSWYIKF